MFMFRLKQKNPPKNTKQTIKLFRKLQILSTKKMHLQQRIIRTKAINRLQLILLFLRHLNTLLQAITITANNNLKKSPNLNSKPPIRQLLKIS